MNSPNCAGERKRPAVETVIGTERKAVDPAPLLRVLLGFGQRAVHPIRRIGMHLLRLIGQPETELDHLCAVGNAERRVAVPHDEILLAADFSDQIDQPLGLFHVVGIGMDEDRAVLESFGGVDVELGHIAAVQLPLLFFHLQPLPVVAVAGMHLAERFHREKEHQLKMRHAPEQRLAIQRRLEALARCGRRTH